MSAGTVPSARARTRAPKGLRTGSRRESIAGWLFVLPAVSVIGLFLVLPALLALFVSLLDWNGTYSPLTGEAPFVGFDNYRALLFDDGLARHNFMTSVRNTFYFVLFVVPAQTLLALLLAITVHQRALKGRAFFRSVFYFPSITSSVAISVIFLFLFAGSGAVNAALGWVGIEGPNWLTDSRGVLHEVAGLVGVDAPPSPLEETTVAGLSLWDWLSGPSIAMITIIVLVVWTTSGTYMLIFLAALQNLPEQVDEAALIDGANWWQRLWKVTVPQLLPTVFMVATLGLIGTWQVFDQVYVMSQGNPAKTTLTPAFLSYQQSFEEGAFGLGAAIAILLFVVIVGLTTLQRILMRDGKTS